MRMIRSMNTIFSRLLTAYILLITLLVSLLGISFYMYFASNFNSEVIKFHEKVANQIQDAIDTHVVQKTNELMVNLTMEKEKNADLLYLFDHPIIGNTYKIFRAYSLLNETVISYDDLIDSIYVFYESNQLFLSSRGMQYRAQPPVRYEHSGGNEGDGAISFIQRYPYQSRSRKSNGFIGIDIRKEAILDIIEKYSIDDFSAVMVVNEEGMPICSMNDAIALSDEMIQSIIDGNIETGNFAQMHHGVESLVFYSKSRYNNWAYFLSIPLENLYIKTASLKGVLVIVSIFVLLLGIVTSNILTSRIYNPITALIKNIAHLFKPTSQPGKVNEYVVINGVINDLSVKVSELEYTLQKSMPIMRHNTLVRILQHENANLDSDLDEKLRMAGIHLYGPMFAAVLFRPGKKSFKNMGYEARQYVKYQLIEYICNCSMMTCYAVEVDDSLIAAIVCIEDHPKVKQDKALDRFLHECIRFAENNLNLALTTSVGMSVDAFYKIHASYRSAQHALEYSFFHPEKRVFYYMDIADLEDGQEYANNRLNSEFQKAVNSNNAMHIAKTFDAIIEDIKTARGSYSAHKKRLMELVLLYDNTYKLRNYSVKEIIEMDILKHLDSMEDIEEFRSSFARIIAQMAAVVENRRNNEYRKHISQAAESYIVENMDNDLSLSRLADHLFLSPNYVSRILKEETGKSFLEFVVHKRMERAFELLMNSRLNVDEVASMVGYNNTAYFIRVFKQTYGRTPGKVKSKVC